MKIFGAGLAGLLAAYHWQDAIVYEARSREDISHKALLRFRTPAVGDAVGIPFKKVTVHKGIWYKDTFVEPNIWLANAYSQKVIGCLADRSIWDTNSVERYIAPEDFIEQLIKRCGDRIRWRCPATEKMFDEDEPIISTVPMKIVHDWLVGDDIVFSFKEIIVKRWRIPDADVYQTIYFPQPDTNLYRASITGDLLIAEYIHHADDYNFFKAFNISPNACNLLHKVAHQQYGKINEIDEEWRKYFIYRLTVDKNVYSLGRYATWRNILLDDVLKDISVIRKMLSSKYEITKHTLTKE
jgi:hypothetical protein